MIKIGLIQHACPLDTLSQPQRNLAVATNMVRDAASQGATLIATQEMFNLPYFPQVEDESRFALAEPIDGPTVSHLRELSRELGVPMHLEKPLTRGAVERLRGLLNTAQGTNDEG